MNNHNLLNGLIVDHEFLDCIEIFPYINDV